MSVQLLKDHETRRGSHADAIVEVADVASSVGSELPTGLGQEAAGKPFFLLTRTSVGSVTNAAALSTDPLRYSWTGTITSPSQVNSGEDLYIADFGDNDENDRFVTLNNALTSSSSVVSFDTKWRNLSASFILYRQTAQPYVWTGNRWQITR